MHLDSVGAGADAELGEGHLRAARIGGDGAWATQAPLLADVEARGVRHEVTPTSGRLRAAGKEAGITVEASRGAAVTMFLGITGHRRTSAAVHFDDLRCTWR